MGSVIVELVNRHSFVLCVSLLYPILNCTSTMLDWSRETHARVYLKMWRNRSGGEKKEKKKGDKMTTDEWVCDGACKNSCWFCFGNQHGHQTEPCTHRWAEGRRQTHLSHTFHTHSLGETKAGELRFTPRNTPSNHGPLVGPLKPEDVFFVLHTNSHSHKNKPHPPTPHSHSHMGTRK